MHVRDPITRQSPARAMSVQQGDNAAMVLDKLPSHQFAREYEEMHPNLETLQTSDLRRFTQIGVTGRTSRPTHISARVPAPGRSRGAGAGTGRQGTGAPQPEIDDVPSEGNPHDPLTTDNVSITVNMSMPYSLDTNSMTCILTRRHMSDILSHAKLETKDIEKVVVHRIVLNSVAGLTDARWALSIRDGAPQPRNVKPLPGTTHSYIKDSQFSITGFPIANHNNANGPTTLFDSDGVVDPDIERYGRFSLDMLTQGVLEWPDRDAQKHMLIPAYPNGMFFFYALVTRSSAPLKNMGMKMKLFDDERYICMPLAEYTMVVNAYREKMKKIEEKMHNLSSMEWTLRPLTDNIRISDHEEVFLSMRIDCAMPNVK